MKKARVEQFNPTRLKLEYWWLIKKTPPKISVHQSHAHLRVKMKSCLKKKPLLKKMNTRTNYKICSTSSQEG